MAHPATALSRAGPRLHYLVGLAPFTGTMGEDWTGCSSETAEPASRVRPPTRTRINSCDVAIIGGGIMGSSLAMFLKENDPSLKVSLIERGFIASEATGLSAGTIWNCGLATEGIGGDGVSSLGYLSMEIYKNLQEREGLDIELVQSGALTVATSQAQVRQWE